jgi:ATP-dependent Clp protease ATP-binding subunit ClpA
MAASDLLYRLTHERLNLNTSPMNPFPLELYGHNLTHVAQQGAFPPLGGYEASVARIFQILLRKEKSRHKYNPLLLDLDGMRRWRVVMEVVRRMAAGEAPEPFSTRQVIALNYEALFANVPASLNSHAFVAPQRPLPDESEWEAALADSGSEERLDQLFAKYFPKGLWPPLEEWNAPNVVLARLQALFLAVRQAGGQILLFVNHFHWLLGGEQHRYAIDASGLLKPVLARREIQLIGACTLAQYRQYIERDGAIECRVQECSIRSDEEL